MKKLKTEYKILGSFFALTLLSGATLSSSFASADSGATVNLSLTVPTSCSLSLVNGTNNVETLSKSINAGIRDTIGTANLKALCNDSGGFAVYAVGYTGDTYGETDLVANDNSGNVIETGYTASNPTDSEWYMSLAAVSGTYAPTIPDGTGGLENFTTNHVIPSVYTKVAYRNSGTDVGNNAAGANFTATFGAYIAPAQPAGIYEGKVKFLLVHPNIIDGSTNPATEAPSVLACDPDSPLLQDVSTWGSTVALGETVDAIDSRDNQCYKVKRLKMNAAGTNTALWMSNLNLGAEPLVVSQLDSTNTHLASGVSPISTASFNTWINNTEAEPWDEPQLFTLNSSNTCTVYDEHANPSYISCPEQDTYGNKYGTLYNFKAASATTYTYEIGYGDNVTSDLCPAGWRLPTGGYDTGEFQAFADSYDIYVDNTWDLSADGAQYVQQNLGFSFAGWADQEIYNQGVNGDYWSSTICGEEYVCDLAFEYMQSNPSYAFGPGNHVINGDASIRCIAN